MDNYRIQQLLEKYDRQTITQEELAELDQWYDAFDEQPDDAHLRSLHTPVKYRLKEKMYATITKTAGVPQRRSFALMRWAAGILLLITSSILLFFWQKNTIISSLVKATNVTVAAPKGKLVKKILPDGSQVTLNAGSTLVYNQFFLGDERKVFLDGEGFFKVTKNKKKPFVVQSGGFQTRVLGTSFSVKSLPELDLFEVTVQTGKVQVEGRNELLAKLLPTQRISIRTGKRPEHSTVYGKEYMLWTEGKIYVDNQSLEEIAWRFEQRYGQKILIEDPLLKSLRYTGDLTGLSIPQALKIINEIHPFEIHSTPSGPVHIRKLEK
ncbi:FecR domain-containing protein [Rapidithrix thailandica]|uniref:FecR domain-containing protein n=1 Tax=Rapidithrix thailandica TaxID=413964 RepID=A0AAW9SDB4_9BACT